MIKESLACTVRTQTESVQRKLLKLHNECDARLYERILYTIQHQSANYGVSSTLFVIKCRDKSVIRSMIRKLRNDGFEVYRNIYGLAIYWTPQPSAFKRMLRRIKAYTGGVNYY